MKGGEIMKLFTTLFGIALAFVFAITPAHAATTMTPFGGATVNPDGTATLVSDLSNASTTDDSSGVGLAIPSGMLFSSLGTLSTTYNTTDDGCISGSPRYQIHLMTTSGTKTIRVYLGPTPGFNVCASGDQTTGNIIGSSDARFDLTQLGGSTNGTYANALALAGSDTIQGIQLIVDGGAGFTDQEQTVIVSNPMVSFSVASAKDQCKDNGFTKFSNPVFKNQGQCVAYFASGGKNMK